MKREKKSTSTSASRHALDPEAEKSLEDFTSVMLESMKHDYQIEMEPFEVYAQKLRSQIHAMPQEFQARIIHGYDILLQELNPKPNS